MNTLSAQGLSWSVPGRTILRDVNLHCPPGTITGLLGPNGSGKSSLLRLLSGQIRPSAGIVRLIEDDVHSLRSRSRARRIALVEQAAETDVDLKVRDVVELGRHPYRVRWSPPGNEDREIINSAMDLAQVAELADRSWLTLSGGERQRVHLARAIAQQPQVLLLDEPTNHLDLRHQLDFLHRVKGLGVTTVAALHDLELAAAFCDQILVLADGSERASGKTTKVLTPDLIQEVWGVSAGTLPHPTRPRPHIWWAEPARPLIEDEGHQ